MIKLYRPKVLLDVREYCYHILHSSMFFQLREPTRYTLLEDYARLLLGTITYSDLNYLCHLLLQKIKFCVYLSTYGVNFAYLPGAPSLSPPVESWSLLNSRGAFRTGTSFPINNTSASAYKKYC